MIANFFDKYVRGVCDNNTCLGGGFNVNHIDADTGETDDDTFIQLLDNVFRKLKAPRRNDSVAVRRAFCECFCRRTLYFDDIRDGGKRFEFQ